MVDQPSGQLEPTQITEPDSRDGFRGVWDLLVTEDESQIDVDLLSAYAEGRLSSQERQRIRARIGTSPRAMEMLDGLCEQMAPETADHATRPAPAAADRQPARSRFARALPATVAAAMLLCVVGLSMWGVSTTDELADIRGELGDANAQLADATTARDESTQQRDEARQELGEREIEFQRLQSRVVATTKEQLLALAGERRPFMTPSMSQRLVANAHSGETTSRGEDELTPEEREQRHTQIAAILAPVEQVLTTFATGANQGDVLDWVDVLIAAGEWRQAQELMDSSELSETAESMNLQAGILISEVADLMNEIGDEAAAQIKDRRTRARTLLIAAVERDPEFDAAWFNLYRVNVDLNNQDDAETARETYTRLTGRTVDAE